MRSSSFKLYTLSLAFIGLLGACIKSDSHVSTNTCNIDFTSSDTSAKHPKNAELTQLITDLTNTGVPGVSVMLEDENGLWFKSSGYADLKEKTPMAPCHLAKVASVSKQYTATLIYQLVGEGKMSLDDLASKYIDEKHVSKIANLEKATVRDLLRHSTGIYDVVFDSDFILYTFNNLDKEKTYEKLLSFAYNKPAAFEYNTKREYNQTLNHVILAMIVEKVTGQSHGDVMKNRIFSPLILQHTYLRSFMDIPWNQVAKGYYDVKKNGVLQDLTPLYTGDGKGFTGIYTSVNDMRIYTQALFKQQKLMNATMYQSMIEIPTLDSTMGIAGGCRAMKVTVNGKEELWYGHPGGEVNYAAGAFYSPTKKATLTFIVNYGIAFDELGKFTDTYYAFRKKLFEAASR
jgi:D-alanyl-D-alanine carboxypeptidase